MPNGWDALRPRLSENCSNKDSAPSRSSGLISLLIQTDSNHAAAVKMAQAIDNKSVDIILPAEVLAETLSVLGKKLGNAVAITTGHTILAHSFFIPYTEPKFINHTLDRLVRQKSSTSFIDCLVMTRGDYYHTTAIFGFDAAFSANSYHLPQPA